MADSHCRSVRYGYLFVFVTLIKIFGSRVLSGIMSFDLVVVIMVGSVSARIILGRSPTLATGIIGLVTLLLLESIFGRIREWRPLRSILMSPGTVVFAHGEFIEHFMKRVWLSKADVIAGLRAKGISDLSEVQCVILECNGSLSAIVKGQTLDRRMFEAVEGKEYVFGGVTDVD